MHQLETTGSVHVYRSQYTVVVTDRSVSIKTPQGWYEEWNSTFTKLDQQTYRIFDALLGISLPIDTVTSHDRFINIIMRYKRFASVRMNAMLEMLITMSGIARISGKEIRFDNRRIAFHDATLGAIIIRDHHTGFVYGSANMGRDYVKIGLDSVLFGIYEMLYTGINLELKIISEAEFLPDGFQTWLNNQKIPTLPRKYYSDIDVVASE